MRVLTERVSVAMTPNQLLAIRELAEESERTVSDAIRLLLRGALREVYRQPKVEAS